MSFRIQGLAPELFQHLFGLSKQALAAHGARRVVAQSQPGFPDRVELRDVAPGESLILLNYTHLDQDSPYRASHAIYVREGATERYDRVDEIPEVLRVRAISLRAFNAKHLMLDADLADGDGVRSTIERMLADPRVAYVHAHYAKPGCYAAQITRA